MSAYIGVSYPEVAARAVQSASQQSPSPVYGYLRSGIHQQVYLFGAIEDAHGWLSALAQPYDYAAVFAATDLTSPVRGLESFGHTAVSGGALVGLTDAELVNRATDDQFYARYPEQRGRRLDPNNPVDRELIAVWKDLHRQTAERAQSLALAGVEVGGPDDGSYPEIAARAVASAAQQSQAPIYGYLRAGSHQRVYLFRTLDDGRGWFGSIAYGQAQPYDYIAVFDATNLSLPVHGLESFGHTAVSGGAYVGQWPLFLLGAAGGGAAGYFLRRWQEQNPGRALPLVPAGKLTAPKIPPSASVPPKAAGDYVGGPWLDIERIGSPWLGNEADTSMKLSALRGAALNMVRGRLAFASTWINPQAMRLWGVTRRVGQGVHDSDAGPIELSSKPDEARAWLRAAAESQRYFYVGLFATRGMEVVDADDWYQAPPVIADERQHSLGGPWLDIEPMVGGPWLDIEPMVGGPWLDVAGQEAGAEVSSADIDVLAHELSRAFGVPVDRTKAELVEAAHELGINVGGPWLDMVGPHVGAWPETRALIESAKREAADAQASAPAAAWVWSLDPSGSSTVRGVQLLGGSTMVTPFSSYAQALDYMRSRIQTPHVALAVFDTASPHWPNPVNWTKSDDPAYAQIIAQRVSAPPRMAGSYGGTTVGTALDDLRARAEALAAKNAGRVVGVIHTSKDGLWHVIAFRSEDDADDWLDTATHDPASYTYASYFNKSDPRFWPHAVIEKISGMRSPPGTDIRRPVASGRWAA